MTLQLKAFLSADISPGDVVPWTADSELPEMNVRVEGRSPRAAISAATALGTEAEAADLTQYDTVFCDSEEALGHLAMQGLSPNVCVRTVSPHLLLHGAGNFKIEPMEGPLKGERYRTFKKAIRPFGIEIYDLCYSHPETRDYARTIARAAVATQNVTLNAACLSDADFREPRLHVRLRTGDASLDQFLNGPWGDLLSGSPNFRTVTVHITPPVSSDLANPARMKRWMHQGLEYFGYRAGLLLSKWAPWLFQGDKVAFVLKENELLFETACHLAWNRIRLEPLARVTGEGQTGGVIPPACEMSLRETFRRFLSRHLCDAAVEPCLDLAIKHISAQVSRQRAAHVAWQKTLSRRKQKDAKAVLLTNYPGRPEDFGLFAACNENRVAMVAFQHGASREINAMHGDVGVENSAAHLTLVYNDAARQRSDETQFHHCTTLAVGYPTIGRRISRLPFLAFEKTEPILYVSTNAYRGYQHMVTTAMTDEQMCEFETGIIRNVLNRAPHRVTYKPYPYLSRYPDADPALLAAHDAKNLSVVSDNVDMRYLIGSAKVVVTSRATSTTGWCLMSGRPVCFINLPDQMPLNEDARAAFEESLFLFDGSRSDLQEALLDFLSLPLQEIDRRWQEKRAARERMLGQFIDLPVKSTGQRAARYIVEHCFASDFFETHGQRTPRRLVDRAEALAVDDPVARLAGGRS